MRHRLLILAAAVGLIVGACGGTSATTAPSVAPASAPPASAAGATPSPTAMPAPAKVTIMVGGMSKQIYLVNKLTEALGYFKDQNLDVTLVDEPSGTDTETEVVAGHADMGSGSYDHTLDLQAQGKIITAVLDMLQTPGEFVMVSTAKAATITSPKDFKGINIGVTSIGSGTHTLMRAMVVDAGLKVADANYVKAGAGDTFIAAMKQGQIDVGITTQPTVLQLETSGVGKLLVDLSKPDTTQAALGGPYPFISLWAKADWIAANKDTVQRVVNAYVKTLKWIQTHTAADIAAKLPADYSAADTAGYIKALTDSYGMFNPTGQFAAGSIESVLKINQMFKDNLTNIDLSKTYDSEFVDKAQQ
jgi:NitT/TauT family transport system substrate-binding protein